METFAENKFYDIHYDKTKNRVYLKIKGFWHSPSDVPNYIMDWEKISVLMAANFTILLDSRDAVTHPKEVQELRQKAQEVAVRNGLLKAAEVVSRNIIAEFQSDTMSKKTNYPKGKFKSMEEAEQWLDEIVAKKRRGETV